MPAPTGIDEAHSALVECVEERLFHALRREVFPFVQPRERTAFRREIWMLEEELGCGHPFFSVETLGSSRGNAEPTYRHKVHEAKTTGLLEGSSPLGAGAAFETDAAHALGVPKFDFPSEEEDGEEDEDETDSNCSTQVPSSPDGLSTPSPAPSPANFWLPVLKRCLTQEHDMAVRTRLVSEIAELEAATRLPSAHDLEKIVEGVWDKGSCQVPPSCCKSVMARSMTWSTPLAHDQN